MKSTLNLFNALPIDTQRCAACNPIVLQKTLEKGFIFSSEVVYNYTTWELLKIVDDISLTPAQMNSSFHKSWGKVADADMRLLIIEQMVHYITTYGFERLGIYDDSTVYVPDEVLTIPEIDISKLALFVIKGLTKPELKTKTMALVQSGIALKDDTMSDILDVFKYVGVNESDIVTIKNKEVKIALYDSFNIIPQDPTEFLRYAVFKSTGNTLLIKNASRIAEIKSGVINLKDRGDISELFYDPNLDLHRLGEIFYRFKPIFLAFKSDPTLRPVINKIRRLATSCHKPMPVDYLNDITGMINRGNTINADKLITELKKANIFRKIRLAYALNYRSSDINATSIMYRIRNGTSYATEFSFNNPYTAELILSLVMKSIGDDIDVKDKKIYVPPHMTYALPATEKQFTGNFPSGSYITIPNDMIVGIHWNDVDQNRIDLDLSMINSEGDKYGWDGGYRDSNRGILFSGDVTTAPAGASELFYVKRQEDGNFIILLNYYNFNEEIPVPFDIIVAEESPEDFDKNYMINPNNVMAMARSIINQRQVILGLLSVTPEESRFYFAESGGGKSITSRNSDHVTHARNYLTAYHKNAISLNDVLVMAGAIMVDEKEGCDIDLSPEVIEKGTIIDLLLNR